MEPYVIALSRVPWLGANGDVRQLLCSCCRVSKDLPPCNEHRPGDPQLPRRGAELTADPTYSEEGEGEKENVLRSRNAVMDTLCASTDIPWLILCS